MNKINVTEFRANLKGMLDAVEDGESVTLERNGVIFELRIKGQESQQKIPWLDLERRIDEIKQLIEKGVPEKNISSATPIDELKEQINAVSYEDFNG